MLPIKHNKIMLILEDTFLSALEEPRQGKSYPTYYNMNKFMSSNDITVTLRDGGMNCLQDINTICTHEINEMNLSYVTLRKHNRPLRNPELECSLEDQMEYLYSYHQINYRKMI